MEREPIGCRRGRDRQFVLGVLVAVIHNERVMTSPSPPEPSIVAVVLVEDAERLEGVLAEVASQSLTPSVVFAAGGGSAAEREATRLAVPWVAEAAALRERLEADVSHVWFLHDDVRLRPDALAALHGESMRVDASVAGSKLLGPDGRQLESIGGLTDVFGHPVSVLDDGELDLGQYDVIRDVAYVPSASLLVRRDLFRGLGGIDRMLAPESAGIDFAQRARLAGARVVVVPSSEAIHAGECRAGAPEWREVAGQLRSLLKAYSAVSLLWVLPTAVVVGVIVALLSILAGRPVRALDYLKAAAWNLKNVRSLVAGRRQLRAARHLGDEELFRYQVGGSEAVSGAWSEFVEALRAPLATSEAVLEWAEERSTGRSAAVLGTGITAWFLAVRLVVFDGLPVIGWSLPLAADWRGVLGSFAGGWNPSGFGSDGPPHPAAALLAHLTRLLGDSTASTVTALAVGIGLLGAYRLLRSLSVGQWAALGGSVIGVLGPAALLLGMAGNWPGLLALGVVPWVMHGVLRPFPEGWMARIGLMARAGLASFLLTAFVPAAATTPVIVGFLGASLGLGWTTLPRGLLVAALGLPAVGSWGVWYSVETMTGAGTQAPWDLPLFVSVGLVVAWLVSLGGASWRLGAVGGVLLGAGATVARGFLPGREISTAGLVLVAAGLVLVGGSAGTRLHLGDGLLRRVGSAVAIAAFLVALLPVGQVVASGTFGLSDSATVADRLRYLVARDRGLGERVLVVGDVGVGDSRSWRGHPYRVTEPAITFDRAWMGSPGPLDEELEARLDAFIAEPGLRAGDLFETFGLAWIIVPPADPLATSLRGRLDVVELTFADVSVFEYTGEAPVGRSIAGPWRYDGSAWVGPPASSVALRINPTDRLERSESGYAGGTGEIPGTPHPDLARAARAAEAMGALLIAGSLVPRRRR